MYTAGGWGGEGRERREGGEVMLESDKEHYPIGEKKNKVGSCLNWESEGRGGREGEKGE